MHKNAMKCNETLSKWCKNKHVASKIIDTLETYQAGKLIEVEDDVAMGHVLAELNDGDPPVEVGLGAGVGVAEESSGS
jgi:hypothetical protein